MKEWLPLHINLRDDKLSFVSHIDGVPSIGDKNSHAMKTNMDESKRYWVGRGRISQQLPCVKLGPVTYRTENIRLPSYRITKRLSISYLKKETGRGDSQDSSAQQEDVPPLFNCSFPKAWWNNHEIFYSSSCFQSLWDPQYDRADKGRNLILAPDVLRRYIPSVSKLQRFSKIPDIVGSISYQWGLERSKSVEIKVIFLYLQKVPDNEYDE